MSLRGFTAELEALASEWRSQIESTAAWSVIGKVPRGQDAGVVVQAGELRGYAKPGRRESLCCRAAHEKIASDLAFDLGLPVPPVLLWRRPKVAITDEEFTAISASAFVPIYAWEQVCHDPELGPRFGAALAPIACAMCPFDTWVGNTDRHNGGNVVVTMQPDGIRAAYIDYAYALSHDWARVPDARARVDAVRPYPTAAPVDPQCARATIDRIEGLPQAQIELIVNRIPDEFLPDGAKSVIVDGLLERRGLLRDAMESSLQEVA
jgi:hypothetical protein